MFKGQLDKTMVKTPSTNVTGEMGAVPKPSKFKGQSEMDTFKNKDFSTPLRKGSMKGEPK